MKQTSLNCIFNFKKVPLLHMNRHLEFHSSNGGFITSYLLTVHELHSSKSLRRPSPSGQVLKGDGIKEEEKRILVTIQQHPLFYVANKCTTDYLDHIWSAAVLISSSWDIYKEGLPHCMKADDPCSLPCEVRFSFTKNIQFKFTAAKG